MGVNFCSLRQFDNLTPDTYYTVADNLQEYFYIQIQYRVKIIKTYFCGRQSAKYWIMCQDDLDVMNESLLKGKGSILLWCDARSTDPPDCGSSHGRKCKGPSASEPVVSKRQQLDENIQDTVKDLKEKHGSKYSFPQLCLWARMIEAGNHDSTDNPPLIPAITITPKCEKSSLSDVIAGAATTFANAFRSPDVHQSNKQSISISSDALSSPVKCNRSPSVTQNTGVSPGKVTELRMKKLRELIKGISRFTGMQYSYAAGVYRTKTASAGFSMQTY